ncbi:hypothetical protein Bbelb_375860 [Branchiostoma belcheri]|nr:hypothetical protein Bbelb_375860 [Branchiostoma belcheri]
MIQVRFWRNVTYRTSGDRMDPRVSLPVGLLVVALMSTSVAGQASVDVDECEAGTHNSTAALKPTVPTSLAVRITCADSPCEHGTCSDDVDEGYTCTCQSGWTGRNCEEQPVYLASQDNWAFYKVRAKGQMSNTNVNATCEAVGMDLPCGESGAAGCTGNWTSGCITYVGTGYSPCYTHSVLSSKLCGTSDSAQCQPLDDTFAYAPGWMDDDSAIGVTFGPTNANILQGAKYTDMYALCAVRITCADSPCEHGTCSDDVDEGYTCTCQSGWTGRNCEEQPVYLASQDNWAFYKVRAKGQMYNTNVNATCEAVGMDYPCYGSGAAGCTYRWTSGCITYVGTGSGPCYTHHVLPTKLCGTWDSRQCQPLDDTFVYTPGVWSDDSTWGVDYDTHTRSLQGAKYTDMYALCAVRITCADSPCEHGTCSDDVDEGYTCTCQSGWTGRNCEEQPVYLASQDNWAFYKVRAKGQMYGPNVNATCEAVGMDLPCGESGAAGCSNTYWTSGCITYVGTGSYPCLTLFVLYTKLCGTGDSAQCQPLDDTFAYTPGSSGDSAWGVIFGPTITSDKNLPGTKYTDMYALCAVRITCADSPCEHGTCSDDVDEGYTCTCQSGWTGRNCEEQPVYLASQDNWAFYKVRAKGQMSNTNVNATCEAVGMDLPCGESGAAGCTGNWTSGCITYVGTGYSPCYTHSVLSSKLCGTSDSAQCQPLDDTFAYAPGWMDDDSAIGVTFGPTNANILQGAKYTDMYALCAVRITCAESPCEHGTCSDDVDEGYTCTCQSGWTGRNCEEQPVYLATQENWAFYKVRAKGQMSNTNVSATCEAVGMDLPCGESGAAGCSNTYWTSDCITYNGTGSDLCGTHWVLSTKLCGISDPRQCQPLDDTFVYIPGWQSDDSALGVDYYTTHYLQGTNYNNMYALCAVATTCAASPCGAHGTCTGGDEGYTCTCESGWTGRNCDALEDVDECEAGTHNCSAHANCTNFPGGFNCTCNAGYSGDGVTCSATTADLSDLTFSDIEMDRMTLSWTASADVTRYRIRYRHAGASYQDLSPPPAPSDTQATVRGLWADTEYNFTLTAFGENDEQILEISGTHKTGEVVVNVDCHQDKMAVTFPRAVLTGVDVETMHLLDDTCRATYTDTVVTFETGLEACGTTQESSEDKLTFTNEAIGNHVVHENDAVRKTPFKKSFQCEFIRQYVVSQNRSFLFNIPHPRVEIVNAENRFTIEMHMYTSRGFIDTYKSADYPVRVTPSDQLHFGLSVNSPLDNLELFARHCLATPSDDHEASPSVNIIQDGCDIDTTLQLNNALSNDMALYYSIQSFTFPNVEDPSLVYIHCTMVVCFKDDPDSRCSQGCIPATRRRRAVSDMSEARVRRASETDETVTISQGPFKVVRGEKQASAVPTVGFAVGTAAGIAGVLLMVAAVFLVRKRRGRDVKEQAEDRVGFDNYSFEVWGKDKAANATPKPE